MPCYEKLKLKVKEFNIQTRLPPKTDKQIQKALKVDTHREVHEKLLKITRDELLQLLEELNKEESQPLEATVPEQRKKKRRRDVEQSEAIEVAA